MIILFKNRIKYYVDNSNKYVNSNINIFQYKAVYFNDRNSH